MVQKQSAATDQDLRQIADMLILNGTLVSCPGLMHGKMGIAVFFFHYAQYTGNELFEDYAMDLIREMQSQLHNNSPADYERGIAGIGAGMDYLIKNQFLCSDDDIFDDFDKRMVRAVLYDPLPDFSLYDGSTGYGRYWMMRLASSKQAKDCLLHIVEQVEENLSDISVPERIDVYRFLQDLSQIQGFEMCTGLMEELEISSVDSPRLDMEKPPAGMGLLTGYAGKGMIRLTELNQLNTSWKNLL